MLAIAIDYSRYRPSAQQRATGLDASIQFLLDHKLSLVLRINTAIHDFSYPKRNDLADSKVNITAGYQDMSIELPSKSLTFGRLTVLIRLSI